MTTMRLQVTLEPAARGGAACELDFDVKEAFGAARAPISVTINGYTFRTTTIAMGGRYFLGINKTHQAGAGITVGETFQVDLEPDHEPRVVKPPVDLAEALEKNARIKKAWNQLSYTDQKEHVRGLEDAKKPETRARRLVKMIERLNASAKVRRQ